ncbi:MAG: esterase-like activity of phytase family protein [Sphingopyxis sp.]|uniref:esterase-like activity of phytase family protein n=1 Tax=Sphingopyxis sp. TaxID=1908224 RepID=UPI002ABC9ACB|nr:esterase-like activity of phytase family protein [Sphingopyxis sp.]MDZ3832488.1 esterase-like activity of phytase family protein [Sphingopyxis sp.]
MRRLFLALLLFLILGPVVGTHQRFPARDTTQAVQAVPLPRAASSTGLRFVRGWELTSPHSLFGSFSGLAKTGPGRFELVGDSGYVTRLTIGRDGEVRDVRIAPLPLPTGHSRRKAMVDAEALAVDSVSKRRWIALEGIDQIWRLDSEYRRVESRGRLPKPGWPANSGAEAMVRLRDGRTVIFSENARGKQGAREALIYSGDPAVPGPAPIRFFYDARGKGRVSDAALLPDGRILLVHRRLGFRPVFTTILALVDPADLTPNAIVRSRAVGRVPAPVAENYEGAAVEEVDGRVFVWLVSDHNYNGWQRSLLVQFEVDALPPPQGADSKKAAP